VLPSDYQVYNSSNGNVIVHIASMSFGWGIGTDDGGNHYLTYDRDWDNFVYYMQTLTFVSAGNRGDIDDEITSPAKALNVVTVGNSGDSNDAMSGDSSAKDPQTKNQKPEISAPGNMITAGGHSLSGTSMAAPHAAGFAADLMSEYTWYQLRPALSKALLLAGSTKPVNGGANAAGVGGLNFVDSYHGATSSWWAGNNSSYAYYDSIDSSPSNGFIEREVFLNSALSNVRVVFAWLNRGDYTYSHRDDTHPIGMDMDIAIYDPNGALVGGSASWDNPYEMVNFDPLVSGTYVVRINRFSNRDTISKFHAGLVINFDW